MKQEIIDLLHNPDQANQLIGCWAGRLDVDGSLTNKMYSYLN